MVDIKNPLGILFVSLIAVVVGVAFIQQISTNTFEQTSFQSVLDESIDFTSARLQNNTINESITFTVAKAPHTNGQSNQSVTNFVVSNSSGGNAVLDTDYNVNTSTGTFNLLNSTFWFTDETNTTLVDYDFANANYITQASSRTMVNLVLLFAVLALLAAVLFYLFRTGIMDVLGG